MKCKSNYSFNYTNGVCITFYNFKAKNIDKMSLKDDKMTIY